MTLVNGRKLIEIGRKEMEEEIITGMDWCLVSARSFLCQQQRPHPLQSVTAHRLQMPWWFPLLESLFLLLLVKLLQL
ncbi:uncharacterized protein LOC117890643 [Drosophila subobscura]|uniref:uncharacterized protein LOC117890643 n=1 Tax=Drosophila subobscura TaxID=7241 RepID=UPI00155A0A0C|nr:uncharacterized protein LOC117890643 [Drosophila subobscura]